jgi:hypothetical protein
MQTHAETLSPCTLQQRQRHRVLKQAMCAAALLLECWSDLSLACAHLSVLSVLNMTRCTSSGNCSCCSTSADVASWQQQQQQQQQQQELVSTRCSLRQQRALHASHGVKKPSSSGSFTADMLLHVRLYVCYI